MLREAHLEDSTTVNKILASEIAALDLELGQPSGFSAPGEGAIWASLRDGDVIWIDDTDPRRVAWAHPDQIPPTSIFLMHAWGQSDKHDDDLEEVCDAGIAKGWGDLPVKFPNADTPLLKKVKKNFLRDDQKTPAKTLQTTFREAKEQRQKTKKVK